MIYAIIVAVYIVGIFVLPVTLWRDKLGNSLGINVPGLVILRRGLDVPGAVWAQEFYEARRGWQLLPVHLVLMLIGRIYKPLAFYERNLEINGHERTVQAEHMMTGFTANAIRMRQALIMSRFYGAFKGHDPKAIELAMAKKSAKAEKFVKRHYKRIQKMNA